MIRVLERDMLAASMRQVAGWRSSLGGYGPDRGPGAILHLLTRAFLIALAIVFLLLLFLL